jgi:hypothetical protein
MRADLASRAAIAIKDADAAVRAAERPEGDKELAARGTPYMRTAHNVVALFGHGHPAGLSPVAAIEAAPLSATVRKERLDSAQPRCIGKEQA